MFSFQQAGTRNRSFLCVVDIGNLKYVQKHNMNCNKVDKRAGIKVGRLKRAEHVQSDIILLVL